LVYLFGAIVRPLGRYDVAWLWATISGVRELAGRVEAA